MTRNKYNSTTLKACDVKAPQVLNLPIAPTVILLVALLYFKPIREFLRLPTAQELSRTYRYAFKAFKAMPWLILAASVTIIPLTQR